METTPRPDPPAVAQFVPLEHFLGQIAEDVRKAEAEHEIRMARYEFRAATRRHFARRYMP